MSSSGTNSGSGIGGAIRKGVGLVHVSFEILQDILLHYQFWVAEVVRILTYPRAPAKPSAAT